MRITKMNASQLNGNMFLISISNIKDGIMTVESGHCLALHSFENGEESNIYTNGKDESFTMKVLTEKGYYSRKKIRISLKGIEVKLVTEDGKKKQFYAISEEIYYSLKEIYNVKGKTFITAWQRDNLSKAIGILAMCEHITDPYCTR